MCKCSKKNTEKIKCPKEYSGECLKELSYYKETKQEPSCQSFWLPIAVILLLAVLFFLPLKCSAQPSRNCCYKNIPNNNISNTWQPNINPDSLLKIIRPDETTINREIVLSPGHIIVKTQEREKWSLVVCRIAFAIIVLLALIFMLKYLVPYWTRIAELNDKQKERLVKLAEERLEYERLPRKTTIDILERQARANIDEKARDEENKRSIDKMKQEYQSHLADVALEIIKAYDQTKDANSINQIIQNLK